MIIPRIIPVLLLQQGGVYKTVKFEKPTYVGDSLNALKIFNEKEVDEIVVLDIAARKQGKQPDYGLIADMAQQCFMPMCYGGGINSLEQISTIIRLGVEKISLNSVVIENSNVLESAAKMYGSSAMVVSLDVKKNFFGKYDVFTNNGTKALKTKPEQFAKYVESLGAGELLVNSIDRDGTGIGYDLDLISSIHDAVRIPIIACGGAGKLEHFKEVHESGASGMAAGSFFVFQGKHKGVLISYPSVESIKRLFIK